MRLEQVYKTEVISTLKKELNLSNDYQVPKITKVVINVGVGKLQPDPKRLEEIATEIAHFTGQWPKKSISKKAIAGFKLKQGSVVGLVVTLRGQRMYNFLEKIINVTLARIRDFRGLSITSFTKGTYSIGLEEHTAFPEIIYENAEKVFGVQATIVTNAKDSQGTKRLLELMGFPFAKEK